jgi:hypothetical protein
VANCPFSIALEYTEDYFRAAQAGGEEAVIRLGAPRWGRWPIFGRRVAVSFGVRADVTDRGRSHDEVLLRWCGRSRLLPDFRGTVRMRIAGHRTRVIVEGEYVPPGGMLGVVFDVLLGRWIAHASLADLAARLAASLGEQERRWRAAAGETAPAG